MCVLPHVWLWETNACGLREKCLFGKINEFVHENFNLLNEWEQFHHGSWGQLSHTSIHYGQIFQMLSNNYKAFYSPKLYLEIQGCNQRGDWCDRSCNTSFIYSWSKRNILEHEFFCLALGSSARALLRVFFFKFHGQRKKRHFFRKTKKLV